MKNYNVKISVAVVVAVIIFGLAGITHAQIQVSGAFEDEHASAFENSATTASPSPLPAPGSMQQPAVANPMPPVQLGTPVPMQLPGHASGALVIPVTVPQMVTYFPPPVNVVVNRPAQLVVSPFPSNPYGMGMPMSFPPMMTQPPMMAQPMMAQQPIPVKMIMPDGSVVSIKHYIPGRFFRNAVRAVTP